MVVMGLFRNYFQALIVSLTTRWWLMWNFAIVYTDGSLSSSRHDELRHANPLTRWLRLQVLKLFVIVDIGRDCVESEHVTTAETDLLPVSRDDDELHVWDKGSSRNKIFPYDAVSLSDSS